MAETAALPRRAEIPTVKRAGTEGTPSSGIAALAAAGSANLESKLEQNSEARQQLRQETLANPMPRPLPVARAPRANFVFKLVGQAEGQTVFLTTEQDVVDPKTGSLRRMRVVRGVPSLWIDEQDKVDKSVIMRNTVSLHFKEGTALVPTADKLVYKAAELMTGNVDNPLRNDGTPVNYYFKEWDPAVESKKELQRKMKSSLAVKSAMEASDEKMMPHAHFLGIDMFDEQGYPAETEQIRALYMDYAMRDPKNFMETVDNPIVATKYMVSYATKNAKFDFAKMEGQAWWNSGNYITSIPEGQDPETYLANWALTDKPEAKRFLKQLQDLSRDTN